MHVYPKMSQSGDVLTVFVSGELDHHNARRLREATDAMIQQKRPSKLRLNFSGVTFMDSAGIGFIMGRYRMMELYGGSVRVVAVPSALQKVMELSGLGCLNVIERSSEEIENIS